MTRKKLNGIFVYYTVCISGCKGNRYFCLLGRGKVCNNYANITYQKQIQVKLMKKMPAYITIVSKNIGNHLFYR